MRLFNVYIFFNKILVTHTGLWGNLKLIFHPRHGVKCEKLRELLDEFSYRHCYGVEGSIWASLISMSQSRFCYLSGKISSYFRISHSYTM